MASKTSLSKETSTSTRSHLLTWQELPHWQQDNHHILAHYRPASYSYTTSFKSLFYLHNEWFNIHSHLIAASFFFCIVVYLGWASDRSVIYAFNGEPVSYSSADVLAFACFFTGAISCLGISAAYHTISNHSPEVNRLGNQLDYVGIVALIWGSFIPSVYYGFHCEPSLQRTYWTMISILAIGCTIVSVTPKFRTPVWRPFRATMFVAMGLSAVFPVLHGLKVYGIEKMNDQIGLTWLVGQGVLYILGAGIYAARIPERWWPGKFDVWGSSHQIFHVLVVLAASVHLIGLTKAWLHAKLGNMC